MRLAAEQFPRAEFGEARSGRRDFLAAQVVTVGVEPAGSAVVDSVGRCFGRAEFRTGDSAWMSSVRFPPFVPISEAMR